MLRFFNNCRLLRSQTTIFLTLDRRHASTPGHHRLRYSLPWVALEQEIRRAPIRLTARGVSVDGALISSIVRARFRGLFSGLLPGSLVFGVERLLLVIERAHDGLQLVAYRNPVDTDRRLYR